MKLKEIKDLLFLMDRFVEEEMPAKESVSVNEKNFLLILQKRLRKGKREYGIEKFTGMKALNVSLHNF